MPAKKILIALLIIVVAVGGFVAGLYLLQERQDIQEKAAVPGGKATVSLEPSTGNFNVGDTIQSKIYFDTANIAVSGVAVRLSYPYNGTTPEVTVSGIDINQSFVNSPDWTCPTKTSSNQSGNVVIDIACANTGASGFTSNGKVEFATLTLKVNRNPEVSPLTLRFDPTYSIITQKSDGRDILLIPTSTGEYSVGGAGSPTPTSPPSTPTLTPSVSPTGTITATPTKAATPTATSSGSKGGVDELPDAGISFPTIMGIGVGLLVILGAVVLAF